MKLWIVLFFGQQIGGAAGPLDMTMQECVARAQQMPGVSRASIMQGGISFEFGQARCVYSPFRPAPFTVT